MKEKIWGITRILMGWIFLWSFIDKLYGLGFTTEAGKAWIDGASPTTGFLKFGTHGPFAEIFQGMAGSVFVDWLFMIGLLLIGLALIFGIGMKVAAYSGSLMLLLMYLAAIPPEHNPIVDDHIIYIFVLMLLYLEDSGKHLGFGETWQKLSVVKKNPILK